MSHLILFGCSCFHPSGYAFLLTRRNKPVFHEEKSIFAFPPDDFFFLFFSFLNWKNSFALWINDNSGGKLTIEIYTLLV